MTSKPRRIRRSRHSLRLWTLEKAKSAVPYLASIVRSLREQTLEIQKLKRKLSFLEEKPRPDRDSIIALEDGGRRLRQLEDEQTSSLSELEQIDAHLQDAMSGLALLPFAYDDQAAWFIFDLFENKIVGWRYQNDPDETRRKLAAVQIA